MKPKAEITKMSNIKNGGNPDHDRGPIINGLKLTAASTATNHEQPTKCYYPTGEALVQSLHDNLGTIMSASRDVFPSPFDLALLDHSHGVLGGVEFLNGQSEISETLEALSPRLPSISTEIGFAYFVPALTMPLAARVKFFHLSNLEKLKVALKTKRVFVNGEVFQEYGGTGKHVPDAGFWSGLFEFNAERAPTDAEITEANVVNFVPGASAAFWLERCIDRDGVEARFIDRLDVNELAIGNAQNLAASLLAYELESASNPDDEWSELKRFGAAPEHIAG